MRTTLVLASAALLAFAAPSVARAEGFSRVLVTCDDDNEGSRKVILANGGTPAGSTKRCETRSPNTCVPPMAAAG